MASLTASTRPAARRHIGRHAACTWRTFTAPVTPRFQRTAEDAADELMKEFGGRIVSRRQLIDGNQLQKLALTLGRRHLSSDGGVGYEEHAIDKMLDVTDSPPPPGTLVPPGYHLVYFTPGGLETELGMDGTDETFNAPSPFNRRMWAGGVMRWPGSADGQSSNSTQLRVGDEAEERTRLVSATRKKSRSAGEMILVELEKEFWTARGLALVDRRSWVFRPALDASRSVEPPPARIERGTRAPSRVRDIDQDGDGFPRRELCWSSVGLFRFSALTFNGHKIHLSEDWARNVEGHAGLVVHGPLNLISILDYWRDVHGRGRATPGQISYRAAAPVYAGETYHVVTRETRPGVDVGGQEWLVDVDKNGITCMSGVVGR
ncbi:hypothetical protein GMORB2_1840 [Geosmithia morbida]|uniref:Uncharacterized protein n=1 Tax=Geosmithia morbida TaxID=1094350 RepID=A0A9P4YQU3_9HYPO|nr:uncharacterized protein GMORB2_1840 [Geosmithia morbida]KAF4121433.1 hypothetical protein GMORB2_1840 [Geosmithia morbida]